MTLELTTKLAEHLGISVEVRVGVLYEGHANPTYFPSTLERWERDAKTYITFGEHIGQERIVWLETATVQRSPWSTDQGRPVS
ncbi:MAG: hypothetical protein ACM3UO_00280 [Bacillota bacterium]